MNNKEKTNVIKFPCYDKYSHGFANYHAQQEINSFLDYWNLGIAQFERTVILKDIDMEGIKKQLFEAIMKRYFDQDQMLKEEYIEDFKERYSDVE